MSDDTKDTKVTQQDRKGGGSLAIRQRIATIIKLIFGVCAVMLALGALLVVFGKNVSADNPVVKFIWDFADAVDGPFGRDNGIFDFDGKNGVKLNALVNWGMAAVIYLIVGNVLRKLLTRSK